MNDLVTQGNWGDDDGDRQVTASGSISVTFKDKNGNTVNRSGALDMCRGAPYKVTLTSTSGTLSTRYGVPRSSNFSGATVDYYINPNDDTRICSVRPNLLYGGTSGIDSGDRSGYAGPSNIWSPTKGFLTQSTSPSSYDRNFPTTGADGLYFDLEIPAGVDASQLNWTVNTSGSITATVSWTRPLAGTFTDPKGDTIQADKWIMDKTKNVTRVTLHGPKADSAQISSNSPGRITVPSLPQTFELVGWNRTHEVRYGFVLKQWFVHRVGKGGFYSNQLAWCNSLGYRLPRGKDLTNASGDSVSGALPSSGANRYMRHIGAGFSTEWGNLSHYANLGFINFNDMYWISDASSDSSRNFITYLSSGSFNRYYSYSYFYAVCTTP